MTTRPNPPVSTPPAPLTARGISAGYGDRAVLRGLDLEIPRGEFTVVVGPNACGKSTLLRTMSRLLSPTGGTVLLDGHDIHTRPSKEVARRLGMLPQTSLAPDGITVEELVGRGRAPHQSFLARGRGGRCRSPGSDRLRRPAAPVRR